MGKRLALFLILIMGISGLSIVKLACAQAITKPSIQEFTAKYIDRSYDTQPTYGLDQYTGKTVITKPSEHVDNRTIEITIKNQPFTPFTDGSGRNINLFYNVRSKGAFGQEWASMFGERMEWEGTYDPYGTYGFPTQNSFSEYTTIIYSLPWNIVDGQMDIQVEALEGYTNRTIDPSREHIIWAVYEYTFYGQESGWSNTETVTIGETSASNSTSPSPTSTVPELSPWIILSVLTVMIVLTGLSVYPKKIQAREVNKS